MAGEQKLKTGGQEFDGNGVIAWEQLVFGENVLVHFSLSKPQQVLTPMGCYFAVGKVHFSYESKWMDAWQLADDIVVTNSECKIQFAKGTRFTSYSRTFQIESSGDFQKVCINSLEPGRVRYINISPSKFSLYQSLRLESGKLIDEKQPGYSVSDSVFHVFGQNLYFSQSKYCPLNLHENGLIRVGLIVKKPVTLAKAVGTSVTLSDKYSNYCVKFDSTGYLENYN